jgi:soluble lytic murein transglycosylase-like protein
VTTPRSGTARTSARDRGRRRRAQARRRRAAVALVLLIGLVVAVVELTDGPGQIAGPPAAGVAVQAHSTDPFSYATSRAAEFTARATAGNANALYTKSPGGAPATARRVATWRGAIDRAVAGTSISPTLLEGLVFVESAGRPEVIAGDHVSDAAGLTQILAETASTQLGMDIDLARSRALTNRIDAVAAGTSPGDLARLERERAAVDPRFDPTAELAATVRYLQDAEATFGREDLAFAGYHAGIGNLQTVLRDYDGGRPVPYVQLYFDTGPDHHAAAFDLLHSLGDDSSLYWWRILGAVEIMHLYRTDPAALAHQTSLQLADDAGATVLHPPGSPARWQSPRALSRAYRRRTLVPLPRNAAALGLAYDPAMGSGAAALSAPRALYEGLRPVALGELIAMAAQVRTVSGGATPLRVAATVQDERFQTAA